MKTIPRILLFLLISTLFLTWQCHKNDQITTTVNGRVYDRVTGEPIEGAHIIFKVNKDNAGEIKEYVQSSGPDGAYSISHTGEEPEKIKHYSTGKDGYLGLGEVPVQFNEGKNVLDFNLLARDGVLCISLQHHFSSEDSIYIKCFNNAYKTYSGIQSPSNSTQLKYESVSVGMTKKIWITLLPGDFQTYIQWGQERPANNVFSFNHQDSIYLPRFDTTTFNIIY
ncbi:MAG: hypothetical protein IT269_10355 [Saprospiraceae bacterium]|nr:hypothetical protein [Saprospiraceae bacterium]